MRKVLFGQVCCLLLASTALAGPYGVCLGVGAAHHDIDVFRAGVIREFSPRWFESRTGYLSWYAELSCNAWAHEGEKVYGIGLSPVLVYHFETGNPAIRPYIEAGIGGAYINDYSINSQNLSSNVLFEDRIGIGVRIHKFDLNLRYMHYSNAGIENPNDGLDIFVGALSWYF